MKIGVYENTEKTKDCVKASAIVSDLTQNGYHCVEITDLSDTALSELSLLLVLGGDGTILRCARACARLGVKIVGINYGTLGFLAEFEKDELAKLPDFLRAVQNVESAKTAHDKNNENAKTAKTAKKTQTLERADDAIAVGELRRFLLEVTYKGERFYAMNEAAIRRDYSQKDSRMLGAQIAVNGYEFDELSGDGALIATPTGSTAYSLSAGGPILSPQTNALLFTPLCAFSLASRPVVFSSCDEISVKIKRGSAFLTLDGETKAKIDENETLCVKVSNLYAAFPTRSLSGFYKKVRKKLS